MARGGQGIPASPPCSTFPGLCPRRQPMAALAPRCTWVHMGPCRAVPCRAAVPWHCATGVNILLEPQLLACSHSWPLEHREIRRQSPAHPPFLAPVSSMLSAPPGPPCPMCDIQRPCVTSTQGREGSVAHAAPCTEHGNGRDVAGAVPGVGASPTPCPDQSHLDFMSRGTGDGWLWRLLLFQERSLGSGEFSVGKTTAMQSTG